MVTSDILGLTLPAPMEETVRSLLGLINRRTMRQGTAVDADVQFLKDGSPTILEAGSIVKLGLVIDAIPAADEGYSIVVQKSTDGGATYSAIAAAIVVDDTAVAGIITEYKGTELYSLLTFTDLEVESGDILRAAIDYTEGEAAAPASGVTMFVDIAPHK